MLTTAIMAPRFRLVLLRTRMPCTRASISRAVVAASSTAPTITRIRS